MDIAFLQAFALGVSETGTITAADLSALRDHQASCERPGEDLEAAGALLAIDRLARDKHPDWSPLLIETLVDILVWDQRPTGVISAAAADWLLSRVTLDSAGLASGAHRALLIALVREAHECDPRLAAAAFGHRVDGPQRAPVARTLGWLDASGLQV